MSVFGDAMSEFDFPTVDPIGLCCKQFFVDGVCESTLGRIMPETREWTEWFEEVLFGLHIEMEGGDALI